MITAYLDFEYHSTQERYVTPVCCTLSVWSNGKQEYIRDYWLWECGKGKTELFKELGLLRARGATLVSFSYSAESRAMLALAVDPLAFNAIDLYLEYRQLANGNEEIEYGKHLVDGKVRFLKPPPKWGEEREQGSDYHPMQYGLASCTYKFLGVNRDTDHKDLMRERIIRGGPYSESEQQQIMAYCHEDVVHLRELHMKMWRYWVGYLQEREESVDEKLLLKEQYKRGEYAARTALMETAGYPLDVEGAKALGANIPILQRSLQRDINETLKGVVPFDVFTWDRKKQDFKRNVGLITQYIEETYGERWPVRTDTKAVSISEEALSKMTSSRHEYKATLVDQLLRFARFQQSINGFRPVREADKKTIWDYLGSDGCVRPYFGIYGSQSSRSQPSATSFVFLKSAVFRGLVHPPAGKIIVASDFGQQEFLVAALLSGDPKMLAAYASGDVYLYFAKLAKAVPMDATKDTHPEMRDRFKSAVLGIQYLMGAVSLAMKITNDTGEHTTEEQAQWLIDTFYGVFSVYHAWQQDLISRYRRAKYRNGPGLTVRLGDGWRLLSDNPNFRSVANMPIQGFGAVAMRCAVAHAQKKGLDVIMTLHDALYEIQAFGRWDLIDLFCECMDAGFEEATRMSFGGKLPKHYIACRQDPQAWGPDFGDVTSIETPKGRKIKTQARYLDKRAAKEYERWAQYMRPDELLL